MSQTSRPRFGIMTAPQQVAYDDILRVWREADVAVPTLIISNDEVMLDSPLPLRGLIDGLGQVHLPRHAEQLAALAA